MKQEIRACIDRKIVTGSTARPRPLGMGDCLWSPGDSLRIRFLDGDPSVQKRVMDAAQEWTQHANLKLRFGNDPKAQIRISFAGKGSWSFIGTECMRVDPLAPTMNLGWLKPETPDDEYSRVVLHEFGHALGLAHEHKHPQSGIQWNERAVLAYYAGEPNFWSEEQTRSNILDAYQHDLLIYDGFDPDSIMLYPVPKEHTTNGFEQGWNRQLSARDKAFIAKVYPG